MMIGRFSDNNRWANSTSKLLNGTDSFVTVFVVNNAGCSESTISEPTISNEPPNLCVVCFNNSLSYPQKNKRKL